MRILADEQFNELTEHIKQLEAENQYLKKLLDDAGIPYDKADKAPEKNEPLVISITQLMHFLFVPQSDLIRYSQYNIHKQ